MSLRCLAPLNVNFLDSSDAVLELLKNNTTPSFAPFADDLISFAGALSQAIRRHPIAARDGNLQSLAFWMRPASIDALKSDFFSQITHNRVRVPRGLVFHIAPANVDTLFMYSWLLAMLAGNYNIVRVSSTESPITRFLLDIYNELAANPLFEHITSRSIFISYDRRGDETASFSLGADVRVIWGGDDTISSIRQFPINPLGKDLVFPDRYSYAVISVADYLALDNKHRGDLASRFVSDTFTFDQLACSSPSLLIWIGELENSRMASADFLQRICVDIKKRNVECPLSVSLKKLNYSASAVLEQDVQYVNRTGPNLTIIGLGNLANFKREQCGGGFLYETNLPELDGLKEFIKRKDQTLSYFGFDIDILRNFATKLGGQGIERIVPIGQALAFNRYWDGMDLLAEMSRIVFISDK